MYIIGFHHDGQTFYIRKGRYSDATADYKKARVFNNIGHVKLWYGSIFQDSRYFVQELKIELGDTIKIEDIYK